MNMRTVLLAAGLAGFSALLLATFLNTGIRAEHSGEVIRFGVLPINQPEAMAERFGPLIAYLERETGEDFERVTWPTAASKNPSSRRWTSPAVTTRPPGSEPRRFPESAAVLRTFAGG